MGDAPFGPCLQVKGRRTAHDKEIYMFNGKEVDFKKVRAKELVVKHCLLWGSCWPYVAQSPLPQACNGLPKLQLAWPTSFDAGWFMWPSLWSHFCRHTNALRLTTAPHLTLSAKLCLKRQWCSCRYC